MHFFRWLLLAVFLIIAAGVSVVLWQTASAPQSASSPAAPAGAPAQPQSVPSPAPAPNASTGGAAVDAARRAEAEAQAAAAARAAAEAAQAKAAADAAAAEAAAQSADKSVAAERHMHARGVPPSVQGAPPVEAPAAAPAPPPVFSEKSVPSPQEPNPATACLSDQICTPVRVFFNTDRKRADMPKRINYGSDRSDTTEFGVATVTVPRAKRTLGEVTRPSWIDTHIWRVPPEGDPARHFTIPDGGVTVYASEDDFVSAMRASVAAGGTYKDHAFIFVHGYDNTFDDGLYRTAQIAYDLGDDSGPFGTAFLYSWPSKGETSGYGYDEESARFTAKHLIDFVTLVAQKSGAKHVHVIAHSMGNLALLTALQGLTQFQGNSAPLIDQLVLAAPDVDRDWFQQVAATIVPFAHNVTLFASSRDRAMQAARKFRAGAPRAGDVTENGPVIAPGVETLDISAADTSVFSIGHNEYAENREMLIDIGKLFTEGAAVHPPDKRQIYKVEHEGGSVFWRYAP